MESRKQIERDHYDRAAAARHGAEDGDDLTLLGSALIDPVLRAPYVDFEQRVRDASGPGKRVLDIGAGTGVHSFAAASGSELFATDIATGPLLLAVERGQRNGMRLQVAAADAERLPFPDASIDVLTSAGVLYCLDFDAMTREALRILRPGGAWIIVDSFNRNPVYRVNRLLGYLRGTRTKLAVTNVPGPRTLRRARAAFASVDVRFYGSFSWAAPLLRRALGTDRAANVLDALDDRIGRPGFLAFKFVAVARAPGAASRAK